MPYIVTSVIKRILSRLRLDKEWWADKSAMTSISLYERSTSFRLRGGLKSSTVVSLLWEAFRIRRYGRLLRGDKSENM